MILLCNVNSVLKYRNLNKVTCSLHNLNKKTSLELDGPCDLTQAVHEGKLNDICYTSDLLRSPFKHIFKLSFITLTMSGILVKGFL